MNNIWKDWDDRLDIHELMVYFGYPMKKEANDYKIYTMGKDHAVVFSTDEGQCYYMCSRPEKKLKAFDLILMAVSKIEKTPSKGLWSKLDDYYTFFAKHTEYHLNPSANSSLNPVSPTFNHFESMVTSLEPATLLEQAILKGCFKGRVFADQQGTLHFPLYNLANSLTGYVKQDGMQTNPIAETDLGASIWYSVVPKKIERLIVFNNPMEAISFQQKFHLENTVYIALKKINYETSKLLVQIYKQSKVGKIILSFTGSSKIQGYIDDLMLISCINDGKFFIRAERDHLMIQFDPESEKALSQLHKEIQNYNFTLNKDYLKFNKLVDHSLLNQKSMVLSKNKEMVSCKLPTEINALRYFLWSYYRNYLGKMIDIIKPEQANWQIELEQTTNKNGNDIKDFKIAI